MSEHIPKPAVDIGAPFDTSTVKISETSEVTIQELIDAYSRLPGLEVSWLKSVSERNRLREALEEIVLCEAPYSRDEHTFAKNVIAKHVKLATKALKLIQEEK